MNKERQRKLEARARRQASLGQLGAVSQEPTPEIKLDANEIVPGNEIALPLLPATVESIPEVAEVISKELPAKAKSDSVKDSHKTKKDLMVSSKNKQKKTGKDKGTRR